MVALDSHQRGLIAAISSVAVVSFSLSVMVPLLALEMERRQTPGFIIGLQTTAMGLTSVFASFFAPVFIKRFGVRLISFFTILFPMLIFPLYPFVENILLWFPMRMATAFCIANLMIASEFWITSIAPAQKRALIMGVHSSFLAAGFAAGPLLLTIVGTRGSFPFFVSAAILACGLLPQLIPSPALPTVDKAARPLAFFTILQIAPLALLAAFFNGGAEHNVYTFLAIWGVRSGMSEIDASLLLTAFGVGSMFLQVPLCHLADKYGRLPMLGVCAGLGALCIAGLPFFADSRYFLYALIIPYGGLIFAIYSIGVAYLGEKFTGGELLTANSAFLMAFALGMLCIPPIAGQGMDYWNPHGTRGRFSGVVGGVCTAGFISNAKVPGAAFIIVGNFRPANSRPRARYGWDRRLQSCSTLCASDQHGRRPCAHPRKHRGPRHC